ncbi:MAG: hypothetical protein P8N63_04320 [Pseudomonadales bacterium]|nr:hypothetical protein [Pseudomonadales bacterium]
MAQRADTTADQRCHQIRVLKLKYGHSVLVVDLSMVPSGLALSPDDEMYVVTRRLVAETGAVLCKAPERPEW